MSCNSIAVESSGHECDVTIDTWLKDMLPRTPGAVRKVVKREFINACREFYEQSFAWRVTTGAKSVRGAKKRYYTSPFDAYANVVGVLGVTYKGSPLKVLPAQPGQYDRTADRPTHYWLETPSEIRLWPVPTADEDAAMTYSLALTPKQTVRHLPRIALTHHYDALLDGALGRLYSHPAKPYSNPTLAQYHLQRFRAAIGKYAGQAKKGYAGASAWTFPRFGK